jgi:hypothetical protein
MIQRTWQGEVIGWGSLKRIYPSRTVGIAFNGEGGEVFFRFTVNLYG